MKYLQYEKGTGKILGVITSSFAIQPKETEIFDYVEFDDSLDPEAHIVENGTPKFIGHRPSIDYDLVDGNWVLNVGRQISRLSSDIRAERERLLFESDWVELVGAEKRLGAKAAQWQKYRQELRDITSQSGFPENVVWPTKPE